SQGNITGGFTQTGTSADVNVSGGTWTLSGAWSTVADDFIVSGVGAILNLNTTDVVRIMSGATSADLTIRSGAVVNINADNAVQYTDSPYRLFVGQGADGADAVLNLNANLQSGRFILGERSLTRVGIVNGTGTLTVDNAAADFIQLYRGEINANIASNGTGAGIFRKVGSGTVILRGDNSGLTNTGTTQIDDGTLVLDFTADNAAKLNGSRALDMRGATLQIIGNASADTLQTVASFTMATGAGLNVIDVTAGSGRTATLALGALTRNTGAGTLRINLNNAGAAVTTSTGNTNGIVGSAAYTTVKDGTGTWFGTNSGGNIVALASTLENSVDAWTRGDHVSDETTGFTGTVSANYLSSLRFNAAGGSSLSLAPGGVLAIGTGGILVTDQVTAGSPGIFGGTLGTGVTEIIVTQDSSQTFEISSWIGVNNAFTTTGTGTVLLSGNNVYTGGTNIQSGKLQVTGNSIGDSSLVTLASNRNSTLELLASETIGRLQGGQRNTNSDYGTVAIGSHTLTLNQTGGTTGYAGVFTGDGSIVMSAASTSTLNMTGLSTGFTGAVVVNGGLFQLSAAGRNDAASFTVNGNGMMLIDNNGSTSSTTRILDTTPIILNSAAGGGTNIRGLWVRNTDNNSSRFETIGDLVFNSGASYLTGEANVSSGNGRTGIIANDFARNDNATVSVRGRNLGTTTTHHNQFRIGTAANQTNFINALTGGGTAGSATISIVPWAIGETHNATSTGSTNMGNSLVTYVSGAGFRPLNFTDEYALYATAGATNNTRETITTDLTGLAGRTLNALVIHNNSTAASALNVTGAGAGNGLVNTSGTFLFTLNPSAAASSAHSLTLGGFDSGITVGGSEYLFFVQNPSAATTTPVLTTTIASALTSTADITKSGRGTLILSGTNTAGGGANKTTINEGVLEIAGLGNIGGSTGDLVFAGGTLRLGAGFTDDLSQRNIAFLPGGGTIDTNGIDLSLAGSLGSGAGGFTKAGAGNLTLNGAATYTGATTVAGGTLTIGANNATGSGDLSVLGGAILALGTNEISVGRVATSGASPLITGTGTITASDGFAFTNTGDITVSAILAGSGGLFKNQSSNLTLDGANTYTGRTEIQNGTLTIGSIGNVGGGGSALGNPGSVEDGVIRMGLTSSATTLAYIGSGHDSDRLVAMQGTTGGVTLNASGTGAIALGGVVGTTPGAKTLTLRGTASAALVNSTGAIHEGVATLAVIKTDANTWSLTAPNTYTGATSINQGVLRLSAVQNMAGALQFGSATSITTAGRLEVNENSTFGSLLAQTNTATANQLDIASGKSLTITGDVRIGSSLDTGSTVSNTFLTATGDGSFIVNNPAANGFFRVGGYPATGTGGTAARGNRADADFSALASMQINLDPATGIIRVNNPSGQNTTGSYATLKVAQTSSLTANQLIVGDGGQFNNGVDQINTVYLGDTANTLNINTILIGTGGRDYGAILFGGATGTVQIRAADGLGRASFNMATAGGTGTGTVNATGNTFDVTGHSADLLFDVVTIGTQNRGHNSNNTFSFDTGVLDMNSLTMAIRSANPGTGTAANWITNSTMNLGGGTVNINNGITALAQITGSLNAATTVNATLNISGGTVNIGQTGGTAVTMATASVGAANAILNLTGGNTALAGSIVRGGGAGTTTATVNLAGGSLDMTGKSIGASGAGEVTFNTQSGTLANLLELNGGGTLTKTTAGMLVMEGNNSYTGATDIVAGTLQIGSGGATGSISATSSINNAGILAFNRSGTLTIGAPIGGSGDVRQIGPGTTVLTGTNDYTGATAVNAGTLLVHGTHTGGGAYTVAGGTLGGTGSIGSVVNVNAGGRLAPGASIGTLAIVGDLTLAGGSVFEWEYDSATADLLNLNGDLNLVGGVSLDLAGPASAVPYGTTYTLISYSGAWNDGIFEGYDNNSRFFAGLNEWQIRYDDVTGGINGGMYGAFVTLTVIPEPTSVVLLLGAIMGLLLSRRRRG
ncbi:MAG: autotransporter-associated beta strand repeat-containing protein, partial [Patescibacteria group bacterium]|nr:autotransporter-associated beta strand repeat-containing protein [Patescibacteria group bacterium]